MTALPSAHWLSALDRMEAALTAAARLLDRAEERWERAVAPSAGEGEPPAALDRLDARLHEWDARLAAAGQLTAAVEQELIVSTAAVERWRDRFVQWEKLIKRS